MMLDRMEGNAELKTLSLIHIWTTTSIRHCWQTRPVTAA